MSEHTPTTAGVREAYGWSGHDNHIVGNRAAKQAEFNRWLVAYKAEVRKAAMEDAAQIVESYIGWTESDRQNPADPDPTDREALVARIRAAALGDAPTGGE